MSSGLEICLRAPAIRLYGDGLASESSDSRFGFGEEVVAHAKPGDFPLLRVRFSRGEEKTAAKTRKEGIFLEASAAITAL